MKGITGIIVAVLLGIAGALANLYYLHTEAQKVETVSFIGVKKSVGSGERLLEDNLVEVKIPQDHVGNLIQFAYKWEALKSITGTPVWHALDCSNGAVLLLRSDIQTPHKELTLNKGEQAACVPLPRNFVAAHINPGDKVYFKFWNTLAAPAPTKASKDPAPAAAAADPPAPRAEETETVFPANGTNEPIGPFVVLSVGTRLDSVDVAKSAKIPQLQENILVIRVSKNVSGEVERYEKLGRLLHSAGSGSYDILLDSKE
jgi:hypothetical protein